MKSCINIIILLCHIASACDLTDTELVTLHDLEMDGDSGDIVEKYKKGLPLSEEEQAYFSSTYDKAIKQKIDQVVEISKSCHAIGGCGPISFTFRDILEDGKEVYISVAERETFKIKADDPKGRFICEPAIFDTLDGYNVSYNGKELAEQTKQAIRQIDRKWYLRNDITAVDKKLFKVINDEDDLSRLFLKRGQINADQLYQEVFSLNDKEGLIIFLQDRKITDETSHISASQLDHTIYIQRNQNHFFLIDPVRTDGTFQTLYRSVDELPDSESLTSFLNHQFTESILLKQRNLQSAINELSELEAQVSEPASLDQLHAINRQINRIEHLKQILRNRGLSDPLAPFNYESNFITASRSR